MFYHTAQTGNFTKAAEVLHITQPSVSYAIKQLEEALGIKLFHRQSKGVTLTEEGKALFQYVEQSFAMLEAGEDKLRAIKRLEAGELRIGASDSMFKHLLKPHLHTFMSRHPNVHLRLSHGKTSDIVRRLQEGQIDCGLVHLPVDEERLEIQPLIHVQPVFVAGESYRRLSDCGPLTAEELRAHPMLLLSSGSSTRIGIDQWFAAQGVTVDADIELGSVGLIIEFAELGFGIACVAREFIQQELREGTLFEIPTTMPIPRRTIALATLHGMPPSLTAAEFVSVLKASLEGGET
nr:LysR family transcriptional regulator [Paenibacillus kobensis]